MQLSIGLYKKSLAFWSAIFMISLSIYGALQNQRPTAQTSLTSAGNLSNLTMTVTLKENGDTFINGVKTKQTIFPAPQKDRFRLKILDGDLRQFDELTIDVKLPKPLDTNSLNAKALLIHSYQNQVEVLTQKNQILLFKARDVSPMAILTITFDLPKKIFKSASFQ